MPLSFLPVAGALPRRNRRSSCVRRAPSMRMGVPLQERVLRLERALAAAVSQERYSDAASLRDALAALRAEDPLLSRRAALEQAVASEDYVRAARLRDELAALTEALARGAAGRRVDRILVLRGRSDPRNALRVATVSNSGGLELGLVPKQEGKSDAPRIFLQPTWSPSGDYIAMTELTFNVEQVGGMRAIAISDSTSRVVVMNAFDGSLVKSAELVKPPFFYAWSPCGKKLTMLSNDPTTQLPKVALSSVHVVAPAGGAGGDLDIVYGPLASGHPLLYDFCPRDSSRVVAHMGNDTSVAIVMTTPHAPLHKVLTQDAGTFGTPQWHPLPGADGREVVLFVEQDMENKPESGRSRSAEKGQVRPSVDSVAKASLADATKDAKGPSTLDSFLESGGSLLETILRRGARTLGFTLDDNPAENGDGDESQTPGPSESGSDASAFDEEETSAPKDKEKVEGYAQQIAGGLRRLLPERPPPLRGYERWGEQYISDKIVNRLVMCDADDPSNKRVLARFSGVMAFKLSPDGQKLATMTTNPATGQDELTLCLGDFSPDSVVEHVNPAKRRAAVAQEADVILSTPYTRVLAFFWSPDSRKLLFLTSLRGSRVGAAQWATFDTVSNRVVRYQKFVLSGIYIHCLNFFDQFAASMTPWSPDSDAFCYPGRELSPTEVEREQAKTGGSPSSVLASLLLQRDSPSDAKPFAAWVQNVPDTANDSVSPELPTPVVDNVEYACWSPC